uniref:Major facilitator superfamily (MFS) profile domain-containing protein n=1 Tax=Mantoniella antarctica TaxID=81844 RepID=A0A7S0XDU2_9CHLO|mmetsp:Transcript_36051/g.89958  ORF Transcript_36051/g.89958 Transcript_36051/m.89958 type:complete len:592 (+) Transcript_36051:210-1985(+)
MGAGEMTSPPVTPARRTALFTLASLHVILCSGTAYGWTAIRPVLLNAGVFAASTEVDQARKLNLMSTMGIAANALCKLPLGMILDKCGPRATSILGGLMVTGGSLLLALGDRDSLYQMASGYFLLGVAGPFVQMPCFQFSELYGAAKGSAMSQLVTCFELSTGVFEVMHMLNVSSWNVSLPSMFIAFSAVGGFITVTAVFFWPDAPHKPPPPPAGAVGSSGAGQPPPPSLTQVSLMKQICSGPFAIATSFMVVHIFRQGLILATIGPQMEAFFPEKQASFLSDAFSIVLPLGFLPMAVLTAAGAAGYILSRPNLAFVFVNLLSMTYGLMLLVPNVYVYFAIFVIFPLARQFVFSTFFSYTAGMFGYASFGRISGVASTIAGLVQLTMSEVVTRTEKGGAPFPATMSAAQRWQIVDLVLALIPALLLVQPIIALAAQRRAERDEASGGDYETDGDDMESGMPGERIGSSRRESRGAALNAPLLMGLDIARESSHISIVDLGNSVSSQVNKGSLCGADKWDIYASSHASPALLSGSYLPSARRPLGTPTSHTSSMLGRSLANPSSGLGSQGQAGSHTVREGFQQSGNDSSDSP